MFKILFVSSGNSEIGISPIVKSQGESLQNAGLKIDYFTISGKGLTGYLKNVVPLRKHTEKNAYDLIHAHYSLSAFTATLAGCKPLVVSLMGSDVRAGTIIISAIKLSALLLWNGLIVKSRDMRESIKIKKNEIIPNGVNTSIFKPVNKNVVIKDLGWDARKRHILFAANPSLHVKNFPLFQKSHELMTSSESTEIHTLKEIPHHDVPKYMNASDVIVLTSLWEGSPNVIKEAMACNRPIVSTDVGDVRWVFGDTPGCYIVPFDPEDVAAKLKMALEFSEKYRQTRGRERILALGIDSETTAKRIIRMYQTILEQNAR